MGVWPGCVPGWISKVGHGYTCPTSSSAWALFKPRDAEPTKTWPLSSRGPQSGDEARPKTSRQRATPKVPGQRLPQVTQPGGLLGRLPGGGGPGRARGGERGPGRGWRRWCFDFRERACDEQGGARHRGLPGQVRGPNGPAQPRLPPAARRVPECPASSRRSSVRLRGGWKPEEPLLRLGVRSGRQHAWRPAALPRASAGSAPPAESAGESAPPDRAGPRRLGSG